MSLQATSRSSGGANSARFPVPSRDGLEVLAAAVDVHIAGFELVAGRGRREAAAFSSSADAVAWTLVTRSQGDKMSPMSHCDGRPGVTVLGGWVMDPVSASLAVAGLLAAGAARGLGEGAGEGLVTRIAARVRGVFGADARSVDALEQVRRDGGQAAVDELAAAMAWYARRDTEFAQDLARWAAQAGAGGVTQHISAGRDAYTAGRDQTVTRYDFSEWGR
jgi:hypothetical protein